MGFFDFLWLVLKSLFFLSLLFVVICIIVVHYGDYKRREEQQRCLRRSKNEEQDRFDRNKEAIGQAVAILRRAQQEIPALATQDISRYEKGREMYLVTISMKNRFQLVVDTCRLKFGDYVTDQALGNVGLEHMMSSNFSLTPSDIFKDLFKSR